MRWTFIIFIVPFILTRLAAPRVAGLFFSGGLVSENFLRRQIPTAVGAVMVFSSTAGYVLAAWTHEDIRLKVFIFLFALTGMSALGLVDDFMGSSEIKGLKGHIAAFLKGDLTSGGIKAFGGAALALGFSLFLSKSAIDLVLNIILISLFTNAVNLFDLRPGRAGKVFILFNFFLFSTALSIQETYLYTSMALPILGSLLAFLPFDLSGTMMMGDAGSNALGIVLGMISVLILSFPLKIIIVLLLISLHIFTEKYSLTEVIKKNKFLRLIDEWGRVK
ncbi:MAG: hypothetical protein GX318_01310 [Clostridia bacterium]|nr:hypothetical protein [Clostridia bacterium]